MELLKFYTSNPLSCHLQPEAQFTITDGTKGEIGMGIGD